MRLTGIAVNFPTSHTQTRSESNLKETGSPHPRWDDHFKYKWQRWGAVVTPRGALKHRSAPFPKSHESTQNQPDVSLCPDAGPRDQHLPQLRECLGSTAHIWIFLKKLSSGCWRAQSRSLFQDPQDKQTKRLREERAKPEQPNAHVQERGGSRKEPNRPPGPGQMENLLCHFYPYLEKQKGGNRTNFIFFRYFRNSLRFQLKRKEFKLDYKKVLFHYFICKSVDFFFQEYTTLWHISI